MAALIAPALVFGGLLGSGRAPMTVVEANESQSGKGYFVKLLAAVYGIILSVVTQSSRGGVGSMQESFGSALEHNAPMISFDNIRGKVDIPGIESFCTESTYKVRIPYREPFDVDTRRTILLATSNKSELTVDLANRSSCIRILKHPDGYAFRSFPEGDLLDHVQANHRTYLAAIFAVVRAWFSKGKPRLQLTGHDFRRWAGTIGYIVKDILGAGELLAGHREAQQRMASPGLTWLRELALAVQKSGKLQTNLRANRLLEIAINHGVAIPGLDAGTDLGDGAEWDNAVRTLGRKLGAVFGGNSELTLDSLRIFRQKGIDERRREKTEYVVFLEFPQVPVSHPQVIPQSNRESPQVPQDNSIDEYLASLVNNGTRINDQLFLMEHLGESGATWGKPEIIRLQANWRSLVNRWWRPKHESLRASCHDVLSGRMALRPRRDIALSSWLRQLHRRVKAAG